MKCTENIAKIMQNRLINARKVNAVPRVHHSIIHKARREKLCEPTKKSIQGEKRKKRVADGGGNMLSLLR